MIVCGVARDPTRVGVSYEVHAGLRNLTGKDNADGTVTIYAITAQTNTVSGGEPDPTKLVAVNDEIAATQLPVDDGKGGGSWGGSKQTLDQFVTLQQSR